MELSDKTLNKIATVLGRAGERYVETLKDNLEVKGTRDGELYDSIQFNVEVMGQDVALFISMEDYAEFVDKGRGPGKFPPPQAIREWIREKGIVYRDRGLEANNRSPEENQRALAYLIGRKISREGTKGKNFIEPFDTKTLAQELEVELKDDISDDIRAELIKGLTNVE